MPPSTKMKTFSELLAEYMARTGISDSELARTLGVRRQTVFRWKEGLVERPRHREDVFRCAQKLRLTSAERDELLLAAGFSPENATATPAVPAAIPEPAPQPAPSRAVPRGALASAAIAALAIFIAAAFALVQFRDNASYPVAAQGETLVVISPFVSPVPLATATPNPRTSTQPSDINARLQSAFEREILAARLEHVRVAVLPLAVRDARAAEEARQRSRATILVWGRFENNTLTATLAISPPASRADDLPLDALIVAPTEMQMKISPDELQALAFLTLAQIYLDRADYDLAHTSATQALARPPSDSESLAALFANLGYVNQISKPPDLDDAIQWHSQAINLAPNAFEPYLNRGVAYLRRNKSTAWQSDFARSLASKPNDLIANRALCWAYALDQKAEQGLPYCDTAANRDTTARSREARAIAYAELGRFNEAARDLQMFLNWLGSQPQSLRARYGTSRADWLESLKQGKSPFDDSTLSRLRRE